jgi:hypothetical protein
LEGRDVELNTQYVWNLRESQVSHGDHCARIAKILGD